MTAEPTHSSSHGHGTHAIKHAVRRLEQLNPDQFEIYFENRTALRIESKDGRVESLSHAQDVGLAVRLVKDSRLGFSYTTSLEEKAIERAVQTALEVASVMPEDRYVGLFSFSSAVYPNIDTFDTQGVRAATEEKIQLARDLESHCRKADPRVTGIRSANVSENITEIQLIDSNGEQISHQTTLYSASVSCKAEEAGDSQMGREYSFSNYLDNLDVATTGALAAKWATELLGAKSAATMQCPAVLRNSVVAQLVSFLSNSFSAEQIDKGRSLLAGKEGQALFSDKVSLIDDGLLPGGFATSPFDGEGIPSTRTLLVDGGFLSGAFYDGYYSRKFGKKPTGSSVRGIKSPPSIGFSNLFVEAGKKSQAQLCEGISKGILITDLMGLHTANPVTGNFSLGASGILIEKGKLTRPVRGLAVAGNVLELFRGMTDIGSDLKFFGNVGAPSVRIGDLSVAGT